MNKQRTLYIPDEVWEEVRVRAIRSGTSASEFVSGILSSNLGVTRVTPVTEAVTGVQAVALNPLRGRLDDVAQPFERIPTVATGGAVVGGIRVHKADAGAVAREVSASVGRRITPAPKPSREERPARRGRAGSLDD